MYMGHMVISINDLYPRAAAVGRLQTEEDWQVVPTRVKRGASIGRGAGAVVTHHALNHIANGFNARLGHSVLKKRL